MLGVSSMLGSSGEGSDGGIGPGSGEDLMKFEESERNSGGGGNRWPRQETLALLKIRSEMDTVFKDSSLKAPLWDEVSRKLAELGYHRNPKKCKEKFENVYKYHKRTKDGRTTKSEGKAYRFFEQLEALDQNQPSSQLLGLPPTPQRPQNQGPESPTPVAMAMPTNIHHQNFLQVTVTSTPSVPSNISQNLNTPITLPLSNPISIATPLPIPIPIPTLPQPRPQSAQVPVPSPNATVSTSNKNATLNQNLNTDSKFHLEYSSPSSSDEEEDPKRRMKRKRKWEGFFEKLMSEVIQRQEQMQKNFLETLERRERDRVAREEAWRAQETARIKREHELIAQERSIAAAKDSAVIAYLQKISDQKQETFTKTQMQAPPPKENPISNATPTPNPNPNPNPSSKPSSTSMLTHVPIFPPTQPPPPPQPMQLQIQPYDNAISNNGITHAAPSSSRWPKEEIEALIQLRTNMDTKYEENGPKGPMWEEVSREMKKIGYDRNAKRCKEKWENINKYFKKVKESNKKRPEDSKTCPYFHLLDQIHKQKAGAGNNAPVGPIMVQPEQQWAPQQPSDEMEGDDEEEDDNDNDNDDDGTGYEVVTNKGAEEN